MVDGLLFFSARDEGGEIPFSEKTSYDSTLHRWWRIDEQNQSCLFFTSPSGIPNSWTLRETSPAVSFSLSSVAVGLNAAGLTSSAPGIAEFDNFNIAPK